MATKLVANVADIEQIAAFGDQADVPALKGWRLMVFGQDALRLQRGEIGLSLAGDRVAIVEKSLAEDAEMTAKAS